MNTILRGSILYAAECYYNLTENRLRIERIEDYKKTIQNCEKLSYFQFLLRI